MSKPYVLDVDKEQVTNIVVRAKVPSGNTEVSIELTTTVGSTREALALIERITHNTGPFRGSDEEPQ